MARVLVLDDEPLIAMMVEDWLGELGHQTIGPANTLSAALTLLDEAIVDCAILDVSIGGQMSYPVAAALTDRGVPFLFVTGHGERHIAPPYDRAPMLSKPFDFQKIAEAMEKLVGP